MPVMKYAINDFILYVARFDRISPSTGVPHQTSTNMYLRSHIKLPEAFEGRRPVQIHQTGEVHGEPYERFEFKLDKIRVDGRTTG
jgi:hypothetical protein